MCRWPLRIGWRSADLMWRIAGDTATDYNHYTKRLILSGVYGSTLLAWLDDQSEGWSETGAFLDRRLADVMRFEKWKAAWRGNDLHRPSLTRFLGRLALPGALTLLVIDNHSHHAMARPMASTLRALIRALLPLIAALTVATGQPRPGRSTASSTAEVQTSWRLLDYIAVDYREAVRGRKDRQSRRISGDGRNSRLRSASA